MMTAREALERLRAGNRRFAAGSSNRTPFADRERRGELLAGQEPFAVILGCSDSRVPPEILFDQGLGDLFVVRVAGNIAAPSGIGSIEYAAAHLGVQLVVVLGHDRCGAVQASVEMLTAGAESPGGNLSSILDPIRPSVEGLLGTKHPEDCESLVEQAVRDNVRASVDRLQQGSEILGPLIASGSLLVVGAEYSLETGVVDFFAGAE